MSKKTTTTVSTLPLLNHREVEDLIVSAGKDVSVHVEGPTGIGKSSLLASIKERTGLLPAYIDMTVMSFGDLMMPVIDKDLKCTDFYPNAAFNIHKGVPCAIMLDELPKAARDVKNMVLPLILERRLGSVKLHPDSIVFSSGNLTTDGLGDVMQAHMLNRMSIVELRAPTAEEWIGNWAMKNDVDETVMAFADEHPQVFHHYRDDPNNEYIFNPSKVQKGFCTPRSLAKASEIVKRRAEITNNALRVALSGTIGASAANQMLSYINLKDKMPSFNVILNDPKKAPLPEDKMTRALAVFTLMAKANKENLTKIMDYVTRFDDELRATFLNRMLSSPATTPWVAIHPATMKHIAELRHIFPSKK